jgi:dihydroorotate dehydrogenase electron transfer subunit
MPRRMPAPPPDARSFVGEVLSVRRTGEDGAVLRVQPKLALAPLRAARFFMLRREDPLSPAIPRPFSVYRQLEGGALEFLIKIMGQGTRALASSRPGDELRVVGPLGNGWPAIGAGSPWVMLAGGIGSAPFYMGIEQALAGMDGERPARTSELTLVYGAARAGLLYEIDAFESLGACTLVATDDGSRGFRGNVLQLLQDAWARGSVPREARLLACGPERMLEAVANLAREHELECWLSLETLMGCGVGICNGCAVFTRPESELGAWPVAKCCVDGPVFRADAVRLH